MAFVVADRVRETSTTTGTGAFTLSGAVIGYQSFSSAIGNGNTTYYTISNPGVNEWEVGIGTVGAGTLTRTTVLASSTGTALVSFTAGSKDVFCTYPSEAAVFADNQVTLTNKTMSGLINTFSNLPNSALTNSSITIGSTSVSLGGTQTSFAGLTGLSSTSITDSGLTSGRVTFAGTGGLLSDSSSLTWNGSTLGVTGALTASADSSFTSTGALLISKGTTLQQPGSPAVGMMRYNTTTNQFEGYSGASPAWKSIGGSALSNDVATASNLYPVFAAATTGTAENLYTSNANYLYKPSTGELSALEHVSTNGIGLNNQTVSANYTIATGNNAMSVGPVTVASGITVTVSSGSIWYIA